MANKMLSFLFLIGLIAVSGCNKTTEVLSPADQLIKDTQIIDDYLAAQKITAVKDPSGLRYVVTSQGTGAKPALYSNVNVNYVGKFLDNGTIFDQSTAGTTFALYTVIQGWQVVLPNINKGSKLTLYVPSGLGYGAYGNSSGSIPGNANLIFEIELLDDSAQLQKDIAIIDKYLDSLKITTAIKDPSGLRYNVTTPGSGSKPTLSNTVYFSYTGKVLKTGVVFGESTSLVSSYLGTTVPPGLQTGFQQIQPNSSVTFYIPSSLAFGLNSSAKSGITANSNIIYTVQFSSIQ
jgi:FKBP-type peptidyl-prolyl cis-trans isomerase FkpA